MKKQSPLGAARGLNGESPGVVTRGVTRGLRGEADTKLPSGGASHGSGPPLHSGANVVPSPNSSRPSEQVVAFTSRPSQPSGEVAGHSLESSTSPGVLDITCPGAGVPGASCLEPGGSRVYSSGCDSDSGSTCLHSHPSEDQRRSILKNNSSILMQRFPVAEKKKSQRWDEMNILATYHPTDKDYGFMKVDEPGTPFHRLQDSDENLLAGSSYKVTPQELEKRFATMDNFLPKVLQNGDNRSSGAADTFSKTHSSDFDKQRKTHYTEGKFLQAQKNLPMEHDEESSGSSAGISSGVRGAMMEPKARPVGKGWAGGPARGVKDETGRLTVRPVPDAKGPCTCKNQIPSASTPISLELIDLQRREYYIQGRYLRSGFHPEPEEDIEDEQQDRTTMSSKNIGSTMASSWCQWLEAKRQKCRSPGSSKNECGNSQNPPAQNGRRHETLRLQWTQEASDTRKWKM